MGEPLRRGEVDADGLRLDQALTRCFVDLGRRRARAAVASGRVFVDGHRCRVAGRLVARGATLLIHPEKEAPERPILDPPILFEDDAWLVLDKPAGWAVNETETSAREAIVERFANRDARVVHRLDRDTTGVLVLAKGAPAAAELSRAFADREVRKVYWAVVEGEGVDGAIDAAIARDRRRPRARAVNEQGQSARTDVRTLTARDGLALVEAQPVTGRTHQVRVHLAHRGAPIVGDALYGGPTAVRLGERIVRPSRPLLHALELELPHPEGRRRFRADVPSDFDPFREYLAGCTDQ